MRNIYSYQVRHKPAAIGTKCPQLTVYDLRMECCAVKPIDVNE